MTEIGNASPAPRSRTARSPCGATRTCCRSTARPPSARQVGFTPLVRAENLAKALGVREVYVKNDAVNHPTLSFKDRVVAVALSKAREFGFQTVGCASTGNLANSVAAHAAEGRFKSYIFIPHDLEQGKVIGTLIYGATVLSVQGNYDEVNRLCSEVAGKYGWGLANVNLRPFYGDGSKTFGYEIAEQLGWKAPQHIVCPSAGGSLVTKIYKALGEFAKLGLIDGVPTKMYCRPGRRLRPHRHHGQGAGRDHAPRPPEHHRQIHRHRQPRRRLLRRRGLPQIRRLGRRPSPTTKWSRASAARPHRRHLHRDRRRRHRQRHSQADRAGRHPARREPSSSASPATASKPRKPSSAKSAKPSPSAPASPPWSKRSATWTSKPPLRRAYKISWGLF